MTRYSVVLQNFPLNNSTKHPRISINNQATLIQVALSLFYHLFTQSCNEIHNQTSVNANRILPVVSQSFMYLTFYV